MIPRVAIVVILAGALAAPAAADPARKQYVLGVGLAADLESSAKFHGQVSLDGSIAARGSLFVRGHLGYGTITRSDDAVAMVDLRAGVETRRCRGITCGVLGGDLGVLVVDPRGSRSPAFQLVALAAGEAGGRNLALRLALEGRLSLDGGVAPDRYSGLELGLQLGFVIRW